MVFAPHCDDETLGVGGLIKTLTAANVPVRTVFFTNGDGFRIAAQFHLKKLNLQPSDYLAFGEARQKEAKSAASRLGQRPEDVEFLSYPDQSLLAMLVASGAAPRTFVPSTTKSDHIPYSSSPSAGSAHVRESVIESIVTQLTTFKPTDVYVTHPLDDHSDHAASPIFLQMAIDRGVEKGYFQRPRVHWYLVHRGDWPLPQGDHSDRWLVPPTAIAESGKQWQSLSLTSNVINAKRAALNCYVSQVNVMQRMLVSFVRKNEIVTAGDAHALQDIEASEPVGDNVARFANPSADIAKVSTSRKQNVITITTTMAGPCSPAIDAYVTLITSGISGSNAYRYKLPRPQLLETQREIDLTIDLNKLEGASDSLTIAVGVSTYAAEGLLVDRSAFHFVPISHGDDANKLHSESKF